MEHGSERKILSIIEMRRFMASKLKSFIKTLLLHENASESSAKFVTSSDLRNIEVREIGLLTRQELIDVFSQKGPYIHFGQSAEDAILSRIFNGKKKGFYVDVGAYNPTEFSNTYIFNRFHGWTGINIDASSDAIEKFNKTRPEDINLNIAVGKEEKIQELTVYSEPARNTFSDKNRERQSDKGDTTVVGTQSVKVVPLGKILDDHLPDNTPIDILDIDIEGYDLQALETNNWSKYRPRVILIEDYEINAGGFNYSEIYKFMNEIDYKFFSHSFDTSIYVDKKNSHNL